MFILEQQNKIIDLLKERGLISEKDQASFKKEAAEGKDVVDVIRKNKQLDGEKITALIAESVNLPYIDLRTTKVEEKKLKILSGELANNYQLAIFDQDKNILKVAIFDPTNFKAQEAMDYVGREKGYRVTYYLVSRESLDKVLEQYSELKSEVSEALDVAKGKLEEKKIEIAKETTEELTEEVIKSAPIAKLVSVILKHAVEGRASDVHIEPFSNNSRVRYRIDGELQTSLLLPKYVHGALVSRIKVLANLKIDETRIPQDGRIRLNFSGHDIDFRVSTLPLYEHEKVVMRILDTSSGALTLPQLGFESRNLKIMEENIKKPHGMFLVTGPTGSGKSTTLYSVLNILNQEGVNIVTLEDPVEYYLTGINQSQVRPEVGLTFAAGLRSILRQDPDVIMVGEIRDGETVELAIHASLTGHIVLSTLHTNDAFGAVPRLIDMKVEPFLLASTLNVIVAQRLVRKICSECKTELKVPESVFKEVEMELKKINKEFWPEELKNSGSIKFYYGAGCEKCNKTGYKGRLAIAEVLANTDTLKDIVSSGKMDTETLKKEFLAQGLLNVKQDGILKALRGLTTIEEIMRATKE